MARYSEKAQPYLDAIALGFFDSREIRNWLIDGTRSGAIYRDAEPLYEEQRNKRWKHKPTKQPFWANYHCGKDTKCTCRIEKSRALESDAIFFLRNLFLRTIAIHIEFKHRNELFEFGQPEGYPLRAECFSRTHKSRKTLNSHEDWATILFCDDKSLGDPRLASFEKVITHSEAAKRLKDWPN